MSQNPYASPDFSGAPPVTPPHLALRIPAIAILVMTTLWWLYCAAINTFVAITRTSRLFDRPRALTADESLEVLGTIAVWIGILAIDGVIIWGAINMLRMRSYRTARAAAILSIVPFCSACFFFGIPFGVWALIVLNRPEVKAAFPPEKPRERAKVAGPPRP